MFSAFSFGKIIKTILPGAILASALLLFVEGVLELCYPHRGFLLADLPKDWITPFTASLIPLSLILGFFLNTFTWITLNTPLRKLCEKEITPTIYATLRTKLTEGLAAELTAYCNKIGAPSGGVSFSPPPPLAYYYLPPVTLTNLNYLWESYFCWYEFDINSAIALIFALAAAVFLLGVRLPQREVLFYGLILALLTAALCTMLWRAAVKNLVSYEKNQILLIAGSLACAAKSVAPAAGAGTGSEHSDQAFLVFPPA
jgi:hypothetical protein